MTQQHGSPGTGQNVLIGALLAAAGVFGLLWAAGVVAALVSEHPVPHGHPVGAFAAFAHPGDPSAAWHAPVGTPVVYWGTLAVFVAVLAALVFFGWRA